ncbi:MAG TPA: phosphatidylglycerol lysyltransferase domain-containing protein [Candidatus Saccharimonadales bacterium]|nr:phosphatidylglycerol lysyltransferase domain-containing protein [Candidatus Saccharimonadales bacterium]
MAFKTFPEFSKLTLADKAEYEALIKDFPPYTDLSFPGLFIWWSLLNSLAVAELYGNLVISYWLPGDDKTSGLAVAGTKHIDETVCNIFDYLREQDKHPRLVCVPEFVISHMRYPELFKFEEQRDQSECVFDLRAFHYPLLSANPNAKRKIKRFVGCVGVENIKIQSLDLTVRSNRNALLNFAIAWENGGRANKIATLEYEVLPIAVENAKDLGIKNICVYIHGTLQGFLMYQLPSDSRYVIATFFKANDRIVGFYDYMLYACARHFSELGITYINFEQDLGVPSLRAEKLRLGPTNFLRKYTVEPAS